MEESKTNHHIFTSEAVSEGHPDKICDAIADAILDACLKVDPDSRVACEVLTTEQFILITGEITRKADTYVDYEGIARGVLRDIGYNSPEIGIDANTCQVEIRIHTQSPDIAEGIKNIDPLNQGAGDQGIVFGYACNETQEYMPLPIVIAQALVKHATELRKNGKFKHARPDMKSQVSIDYTDPDHPKVDTVLMSIQHDDDINLDEFRKFVKTNIMDVIISNFGLNADYKALINPSGRFVIGGPQGDSGLTGRKLVVDSYGGICRHGGGALSGKDPSKVDRSAAYYARYIVKNLVAAGAAKRLEIQLSYAIGVAEPISISFSTFHTANVSDEIISKAIEKFFDARPGSIIKQFNLTHPSFSYRDTANYGCFGRSDLDVPWEELDKKEAIQGFFKSKGYQC